MSVMFFMADGLIVSGYPSLGWRRFPPPLPPGLPVWCLCAIVTWYTPVNFIFHHNVQGQVCFDIGSEGYFLGCQWWGGWICTTQNNTKGVWGVVKLHWQNSMATRNNEKLCNLTLSGELSHRITVCIESPGSHENNTYNNNHVCGQALGAATHTQAAGASPPGVGAREWAARKVLVTEGGTASLICSCFWSSVWPDYRRAEEAKKMPVEFSPAAF